VLSPIHCAPAENMWIPFRLCQVPYRVRRVAGLDNPGVYPRGTILDERLPILDTGTIQSVPVPFSLATIDGIWPSSNPTHIVACVWWHVVPIVGMLCGNAVVGVLIVLSSILKELE
jgi:hypothetical protein